MENNKKDMWGNNKSENFDESSQEERTTRNEETPTTESDKSSQEERTTRNEEMLNPNEVIEETLNPNEVITGRLRGRVVIFVGPREVGKTVTLMRLIKYIKEKHRIRVELNKDFRNGNQYCNAFEEFKNGLVHCDFSPERTGEMNFLVLDAFKDNRLHCRFLEAPGEAYFVPGQPHDEHFSAYLLDILNQDIHKVFVFFFTDAMFRNDTDAEAYSTSLSHMVERMERKNDDVIILYNKCDTRRQFYNGNKPKVREFKGLLHDNKNYTKFFNSLKDSQIRLKFIPYSNGEFRGIPNRDQQRWVHSEDFYPQTLWRSIESCFKSWSWWPWPW